MENNFVKYNQFTLLNSEFVMVENAYVYQGVSDTVFDTIYAIYYAKP